MKKKWERPVTFVQEFIPNEYVAACYSGTCIGGDGNNGAKLSVGDSVLHVKDHPAENVENYSVSSIAYGTFGKSNDKNPMNVMVIYGTDDGSFHFGSFTQSGNAS